MPHVYLTLGEYDLVATIEAPSDEVCVSISLALGSLGNLRSTTLKAFREKGACPIDPLSAGLAKQ